MTDQTQTPQARTPGADFEAMPYTSHPFADTQPGQLAMIAAMLGFDTPAPETARVAELGCASGGNIIPLAARYPDAQFLGIDLSARHVALAQARIKALGLTNIDIRQGDLGESAQITGAWDYVLCHGVFSWVSHEVQAQIFQTCHDILSDRGLAYISYNVLPGWQLRKVVRDIFLFDDDPNRGASERVARGRWMLEQLAQGTQEDSHYGRLLRDEAMTLSKQPDSYILAEFLVDENLPCYFHDFMARAGAAGLAFLSEAKLSLAASGASNPKLEEKVQSLAGINSDNAEQYRDFLTGRQFRQSILYKSAPNAGFRAKIDASPMMAMQYSASMSVKTTQTEGEFRIEDSDNRGFATNDPAVAALFSLLAQAYPATRSPRQMLAFLARVDGLDQDKIGDRVMQALMRTTLAGLVHVSATPITIGTTDDAKPQVWPVARQELHDGQHWATNLAHRPVALDAPSRRLMPLIDGTRDRTTLDRDIGAVLATEADRLGLLNVQTDDPEQISAYVTSLLRQAAKMGLLAPQTPA